MKHESNAAGPAKSPSRRLGVLYVASFSIIAVISAVNQAFALKELAWQSRATANASAVASDRALGRPLSLAALALLTATDPAERRELATSLRSAIQESSQGMPRTVSARGRLESAGAHKRTTASDNQMLQLSESHRLAATLSAETLLSLYDQNSAAPSQPAEAAPHVRRIIEEEEAASHALAEAARGYGAQAAIHFDRFNTFELMMLGVVMLVLATEGLCVVNPAVKRIQRFMDDLERSHVELKAYAHKLERSNSELQDFASVASHDLQEPLRKVQAFSDRLRKRCAAALDDQGRDYLDRIQNAAARMQSLINDLLTYCRVATKAQPFVPTDLVSITREVVSDLEARIEQVQRSSRPGRIAHDRCRPASSPPAHAELDRQFAEVFAAGRSSGREGMEQARAARCGLGGGAPPRPFCEIVVEDNGIGFDQIYSERIFTIFQRLHGRNEYEGTGIGLAVCRQDCRTARRHDHRAQHTRQWGNIPGFAADSPTNRGRQLKMQTNRDSISILIADDDADDRMMAKEALEECRLANPIDFVEDGVELLAYLRGQGRFAGETRRRPGFIILDLNMPKMDGREALREIKADPSLRRIPVVVMTTSQAEEDIYRTYDLGVNSFITKPVSFDGLVDVMRTMGAYWIEIVELPETGRSQEA